MFNENHLNLEFNFGPYFDANKFQKASACQTSSAQPSEQPPATSSLLNDRGSATSIPPMPSPSITFSMEELDPVSRRIHDKAILKAQKYLVSEAELLEAITDVDRHRTYEKFGMTHLTPYCVQYLNLSEDVAGNFVRVARKSLQVPELQKAISESKLSLSKARSLASVITVENQKQWIDKAQTLSKHKLEQEVAQSEPSRPQPEKAKFRGEDTVRVEFDLSLEEMALFRRAQEVVSQKQQIPATLKQTQVEILRFFLKHQDPLKKAQRAQGRNERSLSEERNEA
jgi:hypothetical protein